MIDISWPIVIILAFLVFFVFSDACWKHKVEKLLKKLEDRMPYER